MTRPLRLLYVLRYYPTLSETFVYREVAELVRRGHRITIVAMGERVDGLLADDLPDVTVIRPPRGLAGVKLVGSMAMGWSVDVSDDIISDFGPKIGARIHWLARAVKNGKYDRMHAHFAGEAAEWCWGASRIARVPFSVTVHAADLFKPRARIQQVLRGADRVFAVSERNCNEIRERYGLEVDRVRCGVNPDRYPQADASQNEPLNAVSVGRWVPKKGLDLLVKAINESDRPWRLRLVSDAPPEVVGPRVERGFLAPTDVPAALGRAQVFVLPCRVADDGDQDGIPVSLMEAMACGLPVITTTVSGIPELVDDAVGWLVPPDDLPALVRALNTAAKDPAERARRGAEARERILSEGWTVSRQVDEIEAAWSR